MLNTLSVATQRQPLSAEDATGDEPALPAIPVIDVGGDFALKTLTADPERAHALFDAATGAVPAAALRLGDKVSRQWLAKWNNAHLAEIDEIAAAMGRPGTYFLSVNYEWGCTTAARPGPDGKSARLIRVLDWRTQGLGRHVMAAKVAASAGDFVTLTWPGYTGVLQAMAPGRFAAALNQAPMRKSVGVMPLDWAANRARVWKMPHMTPAHLLRMVFESAKDYGDAKRLLSSTPISTPAIFTLSGLGGDETCVIERSETEARQHQGPAFAANHWMNGDWDGRPRGRQSRQRRRQMEHVAADLDADLSWLAAPILNERTRLVMLADASRGRLTAQGFEAGRPATQALDLSL